MDTLTIIPAVYVLELALRPHLRTFELDVPSYDTDRMRVGRVERVSR